MSIRDNLRKLKNYEESIKIAKRSVVVVGLPVEKVGGKIYGDGITVVQVGAWHEFGEGNNPVRSFLRVPFSIKADELNDFTAQQFAKVFEGEDVEKALGLIGVKATNISRQAFTTQGFGTWPANKVSTVRAKGSSQPLIDTGTLRNSITWSVRTGS